MTTQDIARFRLINQQIIRTKCRTPGEVVAHLLAMQGQDFMGAKWSIGLRCPGCTDAQVEAAIAERSIIRTWPMRGTLHFVAAADVHWMLELLTKRTLGGSAARHNSLGIDGAMLARSRKLFYHGLTGGRSLTRPQMYSVLEKDGISTSGQRGYHILWQAAQEGLICFGPLVHNEQTFVLLKEWVPQITQMDRRQALGELAQRFFTSHGPATIADLIRWSGLMVIDARAGLESIASTLRSEEVDGQMYWMPQDLPDISENVPRVHLLPGFDEYILGYHDRSAVLALPHAQKICPGNNGMFSSTIIVDGRVAGTWKRTLTPGGVAVTPTPFTELTPAERDSLTAAAERYAKFLGREVKVESIESIKS